MKAAVISHKNQPHTLANEIVDLQNTIKKKDQQIEQLLDYIQLLRQKQFGRSSEKVSKDQLNLFDESELEQLLVECDEASPEETLTVQDAPSQAAVKKQKPDRRPLPEKLNRIEKIIDVSDEEKKQMKNDWTLIGYGSAEQLAVIPRQH